MFNKIIRLNKIHFLNFKNIKKSTVNIESDEYKSVIGIYGANGSGKTAIIDSIGILKYIMTGEKIIFPYYYINVDSTKTRLTYSLSYEDGKVAYDVKYTVEFAKSDRNVSFSKESIEFITNDVTTKISINRLAKNVKGAIKIDGKEYTDNVFDTDELNRVFYVNNSDDVSIIFGGLDSCFNDKDVFDKLSHILKDLKNYAIFNMFVIEMRETSLIAASDKILFHVSILDNKGVTVGTQVCNLLGNSKIPKVHLDAFKFAIEQCNKILSVVIPGFSIKLHELPGTVLDSNNNECINVMFYSKRDSNKELLPLVYESEGIKKIIAIISALIFCYNNRSALVAIDEFDASIYEYLLGQLIQTMSNSGKGQLIFTSHNLRILEVVDVNSVVFTTLNPLNRFIKFRNLKPTNNLRSLYIRTLQIGGQKEEFYKPLDSVELKIAFIQANKPREEV